MTGTAWILDNIGELTTHDAAHPDGVLTQAALVVEDGKIAWVGSAADAPAADHRIDAAGAAVLPGWVDSHSHLVFAGDRTDEFAARMAGAPYEAGGINRTVAATRAASDAELRSTLDTLLAEAHRGGTTTMETKTGYGLTVTDEARAARIAAERVDSVTFLGAHVVPAGEDPEQYLELVCGDMLAAVRPYVSAVDVFCERGAFDEAASRRVLASAVAAGLATRVHGNQLGPGPGVQLAVEYGSLSVDHLGFLSDADIAALADSWSGNRRGTVATVLPACDVSTRMPFPPARTLIDSGATLALASNCNPGSSYTTSMAYCVATAVLQMHLSVTEAVRAATLGGARALGMDHDGWLDPRGVSQPRVGELTPGARADIHLLNAPSATHLAYRPGIPLTNRVWKAGVELTAAGASHRFA